MKNKLKYLFVLSSLFVFLMCGSVFARGELSNGFVVTIPTGYPTTITVRSEGSNLVYGCTQNGLSAFYSEGQYYMSNLGAWPVTGYRLLEPCRATNLIELPVEYDIRNSQDVIDFFMGSDVEDFDPSANSTLDGFNELGFVGGWGERRNVLNNVYNGHTYATLEMENFDFNSVTVDGQHKYDLSAQGYDELYIQFAYKGFGTYWVQGSDGSIAQCPKTTNYDIWYNRGSSSGHYGGDITPLNSDGLLAYSTSRSSYSFKRPLFEWFENMISGRDTEQFHFNNALGSYFKGNFSLSARYVALQDGRYIYGPWTDSYSNLTDKDNNIPSDPTNTVNKKPTTIVRVEPTENPDIDIPHEITLPNNDTTIYFPYVTISPDGDGDGENDVTVNVTVNDINGNIVSSDTLKDNELNIDTMVEWTTQLVQSVKNVPLALSDLFAFFDDWVLVLFTVSFGLLIIFRLLK